MFELRTISLTAIALSAVVALSPGRLAAQGCSQADKATFNAAATACTLQHAVTATVPYLASINSTAVTTVSLGAASVSDMNSGYTAAAAGPAITVSANFQYSLVASSSGFGAIGKSAGDLEMATAASSAPPTAGWRAFNSQLDLLASQAATAQSATLYTYFRMKLRWASDAPGTYSSTVTYTLVAP